MYRGSPFRSTWTWVTLGLGMCKVCTEAVHCVALWTRVTLGLGMCKVCTEAVHCVSSPLQAFWRWSPLQAPFTPPWKLQAPSPSSPLQAPLKPPSSFLKPRRSPFHLRKAATPLQAPLKPPWSPLKPSEGEAPLKPPSSPFEAPLKPPLSPLEPSFSVEGFKPPWSPLEAPFKPLEAPQAFPSEGEATLKPSKGRAPFKPSWRVPLKGASLKVKPPSSLKGDLPEGPRNLPDTLQVCITGLVLWYNAVLFLLLFFRKSAITWEQTRSGLIDRGQKGNRPDCDVVEPSRMQTKKNIWACMLPSVVSRFLVQWFSPHIQASGLVMLVAIIFFDTASVLPSFVTSSTQPPFRAIFLPVCSMHRHWLERSSRWLPWPVV